MYQLPPLKYKFEELHPHIDAKTVEIHYSKHHQNYLNNLNQALEKLSEFKDVEIEDLLTKLDMLPSDQKTFITNNAGGYYNHNVYWSIMSPKPKTSVSGNLETLIKSTFMSLENLKEVFNKSAMSVFGSGWTWLTYSDDKLEIINTKNQDTPLALGKKPLLALDLWEHAYYLNYQNKRLDYVNAWWNLVDWAVVEDLFNKYTIKA